MSKRFFKSFLSSLLALLMIVSLAAIPSSAASIALSKTSLSLTKGYSTTLKVSGTSSKVSWSTGDKTIATVSSTGKVAGKGVGTTYIYAKVSGKTLKCKVSVVAGKITLGKSSVTMDKGDKTTVTVTALGTHVISATSTDKSIVKATWNGAKFDGNKIKLTLTAMGEGTARVKVYAKNYASTIYKYINVTVEGNSLTDDDSSGVISGDKITIAPGVSSVTVNASEKTTFSVYSNSPSSLGVVSSDITVASAAITGTSGNYSTVTITGLKEGSAFVRVYNKYNVKNYADVTVTVKAGTYYVLLNTCPVKTGTDQVIQVNTSSGTKYMLVPANYDPAYANTMIAKQTNTYQYYTLYTEYPIKKTATDIIEAVTPYTNSSDSSKWSLQRYIIKPQNFDQAAVDTAISNYTSE
ncbi:MAG: Ig domain-containing protein, partial [Huintestinicola sp.]